jgi:hypothetical protein
VQLEWVYGYERLLLDWCSIMSDSQTEVTRRPLLEHPQRRGRGGGD